MSHAIQKCAATLYALEIRVLDPQGGPLEDVIVTLQGKDGLVLHDRSDGQGIARFAGLAPAPYHYTLREASADLWAPGACRALAEPLASPGEDAHWCADDAAVPPPVHTVQWGECLYSIAHRYGLAAQDIWALPENRRYAEGGVSKHGRTEAVLQPGDQLALPVHTLRWEPANQGAQYDAVLHTERYVFKATLLDESAARAGIECLVKRDGVSLLATTDQEGNLEVPISAGTESVLVVINEHEVLEITLGELLPVTTVGGAERRLMNMGYLLYPLQDYDAASARLALAAAIRWFQNDFGVAATGVLDADGCALLLRAHGS